MELLTVRYCVTCEAESSFEQPECLDEHGRDCPDWVCSRCGDAFLLGFPHTEGIAAGQDAQHVA